MSGFIDSLDKLNEKDTKVRAVLRRSLAFDPGAFPAAFPFVEPFVRNEDNSWRRQVLYLVAGLWAAHWRERSERRANLPWKGVRRLTKNKANPRAPNAVSSLCWMQTRSSCQTDCGRWSHCSKTTILTLKPC